MQPFCRNGEASNIDTYDYNSAFKKQATQPASKSIALVQGERKSHDKRNSRCAIALAIRPHRDVAFYLCPLTPGLSFLPACSFGIINAMWLEAQDKENSGQSE